MVTVFDRSNYDLLVDKSPSLRRRRVDYRIYVPVSVLFLGDICLATSSSATKAHPFPHPPPHDHAAHCLGEIVIDDVHYFKLPNLQALRRRRRKSESSLNGRRGVARVTRTICMWRIDNGNIAATSATFADAAVQSETC